MPENTDAQQQADESQGQGPDAGGGDNALPPMDEKTAKLMEKDEATIAEIVSLAVETLDPKDMLKKYAKLGAAVIRHARWQKSKFARWEKKDFERLCEKVTDQVKFQVAIKDVRMSLFARLHLWVEAVKAIVPNVEQLSFHAVANRFLPTLDFDPVDLTGEIRPEWLTWVRTTVERQLGDGRMSDNDLKQSYADEKARIEREKNAKRSPEKQLELEQKAAEAAARAEKKAAVNKVADSIDKALAAEHVDGLSLAQIVAAVAKDHNIAMPTVGFDPETCSKKDCKTLAQAMWGHGKIAEMQYLRDQLDMMVKMAMNAMVESKTA